MRKRPPEPTTRLRDVQSGLLADLTGREPRTADEHAALFRTPHRGTLEGRWTVYTTGYLARLVEALENDYPALRRLLGEGPFGSLVARFIRAVPPTSFDLGRSGERLAEFLASDPLAEDLPFLPDLARLEWALAEAFVSADVRTLSWADLATRDPDVVAGLALVPRPGTRLIRSRWPIHDLRECRNTPDGEIDIEIEGRPCTVIVHRKGLDLVCRPVDEDEIRFLEAAQRGLNLATICDAWPAGGEPPPMDRLLALFRRFVEDELFQDSGIPGYSTTL